MTHHQRNLYWFLSLGYLLLLNWTPFPGHWLVKTLPMLALMWPAQSLKESYQHKLVMVALAFSALGDALLPLGFFIYGLLAFLVAQICYTLCFLKKRSWRPTRFSLFVVLLLYIATMCFLLWPNLGDLRLPVVAYMLVISGMGLSAIMSQYALVPLALGALTFIASDSLIAVDRFLMPLPARDVLVLTTYFAAQYWIVSGLLKARNR